MSAMNFGRLEKVALREVWESQTNGFSPWLAQEENLALLGEVLDLELELEVEEQDAGTLRADIVCQETTTGNPVLFSIQIEPNDHAHLGRLLTRAAGLKAGTVVWAADHFSDEHRAVLDWLNQISDENINFFGLEIELWRIGDSPVAPKFNLVSQANNSRRTISQADEEIEAGDLSVTRQLHLDFWSEFRDYLIQRQSPVRPPTPQAQNWVDYAAERPYFNFVAFLNTDEDRTGVILVVHGPQAKAHYHLLHQDRAEIERQIGQQLEWLEKPGNKESHIRLQRVDIDPFDRDRWPEYRAWLAEKLEAFHQVFSLRIKQLNATDYIPKESVS